MNHQSRFDERYWMLGAGALGRPRGRVWGGRRAEGSGWGARVYLWQIHFDIWQNQYNIVKFKKKKKRPGHGTTDWFQIGKGVHKGCILSPCLFSLYAEYIMRNAGLEEAQAGIKTAGRNSNNLRYADDTIVMAENEEELKSFLMKVKEESEKIGLKLNIQKMKITASGPITS